MKLRYLLILILFFNSACSVYRSDGRKDFESLDFSKASFYLMDCQKVESHSKLKDQLINFGYEEEASTPFSILSKNEAPYFHVVSLTDINQSCHWAFANKESFLENSAEFIDMLATFSLNESTTP